MQVIGTSFTFVNPVIQSIEIMVRPVTATCRCIHVYTCPVLAMPYQPEAAPHLWDRPRLCRKSRLGCGFIVLAFAEILGQTIE